MKTTYEFDELHLQEGCDVFAYGEAEIEFSVGKPEPDIGIFDRYVEDLWVCSIDVGRVLDPSEPLFKLIEAALYRETERIAAACMATL